MMIGLSVNTLQPSVTTARQELDGIGVYTTMLWRELTALQQQIMPVHYSSSVFSRSADAKQACFRVPFALSSLASVALRMSTPGQRALCRQLDVYHCTDYHQPKLRHVPIVTTLHDAIFLQYPQWCRQRLRHLKNYVIRRLAQQAAHVICVSYAAMHDVNQYFNIPLEKMTVIHHGVDDYWWQSVTALEQERILQQLGIQKKFLLFTGTIQPRKNLYRLLQAYLQLPQELRQKFQLVVVGKYGWDEKALHLLQRLTASAAVKWLGHVSRAQLRGLYQASEAFIFPSLYEGFGLPLLEAFASNTPVISSNCSAIPEISQGAALLMDPLDVDSLTAAITRVLTEPMLRHELVARGQQRARLFSWGRCAQKTLAIYQRVIS